MLIHGAHMESLNFGMYFALHLLIEKSLIMYTNCYHWNLAHTFTDHPVEFVLKMLFFYRCLDIA